MKRSLDRLLANRHFGVDDKEAIERVHMLLVEYAWTTDSLTCEAKGLKQAMLKVWAFWKRRSS